MTPRREYAPQYSLRSYFYLLPSICAANVSRALLGVIGHHNDKLQAGDTMVVRVSVLVLCTLLGLG